jgi:hypothetical protein
MDIAQFENMDNPELSRIGNYPVNPNLNVYLLEQVKMAITGEPAQFAMENFFRQDAIDEPTRCGVDNCTICENLDPKDLPRKIPNCGTAACIAGYASALTVIDEVVFDVEPEDPPLLSLLSLKERVYERFKRSTWYGADQILGLGSDGEANRLFLARSWPKKFHDRWRAAKTLEERAIIACERIDHFIATEGNE